MFRDASVGAASAYLLNLAWETAQAPLYAGYANFWQHFAMCATASVGDVGLVTLLYAFVAAAERNAKWYVEFRWQRHGFMLAIFGAIFAIAIERWALLTGRWQYADMPVLPTIEVGLLPFVQMVLIPPAVFFLMRAAHRDRA